MMVPQDYILLVLGMGLVTFIPRWAPLFLMARRNLPGWVIEWLDLIPVAILSALLLPELLKAGTPPRLDFFKPELAAALPTFLFALKTRSLGGTVMVGMFSYWLLTKFML